MQDRKPDYSVVVPLYNEAGNVTELCARIKKVMEGVGGSYEIIIVDDGSRDGSFELLRAIALLDNKIKIVRFDKNYGQHKAVAAGVFEASGEYIITIDADLQNPPEEIVKLIQKSKEGYDMVAGYRKSRKDGIRRRLPSMLTNFVISSINGLKMKDYGSMLRVFKRETARALIEEYLKSEGYITMFIAKVTRNVAEVEVQHDERHAGASKYNIWKLVSMFYKILFYYNDTLRRLVKKDYEGPQFIIERKIEDGKEIIVSVKAG